MKTAVSLLVIGLLSFCGEAFAAGPLPGVVRKTIDDNLVGKWDINITHDGETISGGWNVKWSPGRHCVIVEARAPAEAGGGNILGTGLLGWDSGMKSLLHHQFSSDGDHFTIRWTNISSDKWTGKVKGISNRELHESACIVEWKGDSFEYRDTTAGKPFLFKAVRRK